MTETPLHFLTHTLPALMPAAGSSALTALRIVAIVLAAWLAQALTQRALRLLRRRIGERLDDAEALKRAETLNRVFRYLAGVVITLIAGMLVLGELGVSLAPILGAAGVVGLAVGFGAQSLVKDFFTGFFLLLENQVRQGDVVRLGEHSGLVEEVTLRYVQLRDYDGHVHFVPNGHISTVVNMSRGHAHAVIDVEVSYREELDRVIGVMRGVGAELRADPAFAERILDELEVAGVERWSDAAVTLRVRLRVAPLQQWGVRREYLRRLKQAFDREGIEIPLPRLALHRGSGPARAASGSAGAA